MASQSKINGRNGMKSKGLGTNQDDKGGSLGFETFVRAALQTGKPPKAKRPPKKRKTRT